MRFFFHFHLILPFFLNFLGRLPIGTPVKLMSWTCREGPSENPVEPDNGITHVRVVILKWHLDPGRRGKMYQVGVGCPSMSSLQENLKELKIAYSGIGENCPWLGTQSVDGTFTPYGDSGALCKPPQKAAAGRHAGKAYQALRRMELDCLTEIRRVFRDQLSRHRALDEETGRFIAKDLFEKCEEITGCISCSCGSAVSAYHNLGNLLELLESDTT
jgi:hypothetical protein